MVETLLLSIKFSKLFFKKTNFLSIITLFVVVLSSFLFFVGLLLLGLYLQDLLFNSPVRLSQATNILSQFNLLELSAITIFIALILEYLSSWLTSRTCANFGARVVADNYKIHQYKTKKEIKHVFEIGKIATRLSRLLINSIVPLGIALMGCLILGYLNLILGFVSLIIFIISVSLFAPIHYITLKSIKKSKTDYNIYDQDIKQIQLAYLPLMRIYLNRKRISTTLNFIIFAFILSIFYFLTVEEIITFFSAETLLFIAVFKASVTSLSRVMVFFQYVLFHLDIVNITLQFINGDNINNTGFGKIEQDNDC